VELDAIKKALSLGQNFVENQARGAPIPEVDGRLGSREENQELIYGIFMAYQRGL